MLNGVESILLPQQPFWREPGPAPGWDPHDFPRPFFAGPENRLVVAALRAVLDEATPRYNPLVLYGPCGTGKTHLAGGLALEFQRRWPAARVVSLAGADFAREFIEAIDQHQTAAFQARLRTANLLVIDNLMQLGGRGAAQLELLLTLDAVWQQGGLTVITSRYAPGVMPGLPAPLQSRLCGGLEVPLAPPGEAARLAILEHLAEIRGLNLPRPAAKILAEGVLGTAAELQGALLTLASEQWTGGRNIDEAAARAYVAQRDAGAAVDLRTIALQTARHFGIKLSELKSPSRRRAVVQARGVAAYLARQMTTISLERIGAYFGGRDHTTVLHGCRKTEELISNDPGTLQAVSILRRKLQHQE